MSTKNYFLNNHAIDNIDKQYSNLNLNENLTTTFESAQLIKSSILSNSTTTNDSYDPFHSEKGSRCEDMSWKSKVLDEVLKRNTKTEVGDEKICKENNNSTLSLHISAYENYAETSDDITISNEACKSKNRKEIFGDIQQREIPFEFPRQQEDNRIVDPEVAGFRANQILLNPDDAAPRRSQRPRRAVVQFPSPGLSPITRRVRSTGSIRQQRSQSQAREVIPQVQQRRSRSRSPVRTPPIHRSPSPERRPSPRVLANQYLRPNERQQEEGNVFLVVSNGVYVFSCPKADVRGAGRIGAEFFYNDHLGRVIQTFNDRLDAREFTRNYASTNFLILKIKTRTGWLSEVFPRPENAPELQASRETLNALAIGIRTDNLEAQQSITATLRGELNRMTTSFRNEIDAIRAENRAFVEAINTNTQTVMDTVANAVNTIQTLVQQLIQNNPGQNIAAVGGDAPLNQQFQVVIPQLQLPQPPPIVEAVVGPNFARITRPALTVLKRQYANSYDFAYQLCNYTITKKESLEGVTEQLKNDLFQLCYLAENATTTQAEATCRRNVLNAIPKQKNIILNGLRAKAKSSSVGISVVCSVGTAIELQAQTLPVIDGDEAAPEGAKYYVPKNLPSTEWTRPALLELKKWPILLDRNGQKREYCIYAEGRDVGQRHLNYLYFLINTIDETRTVLRE